MDLIAVIIALAILIYSAILHEVAHGFVAERLGDPTARLLGRLTLNPKSHIDPIMTILFPIITFFGSGGTLIFGGAKPVPIDPFNLRDGRKDMAIISLAGPGTNLLIAAFFALTCRLLFPGLPLEAVRNSGFIGSILGTAVYLNLLLAIFNFLPIPPLDGSKIFALLLPEKEAAAYLSIGTFGILIILILLQFPIGGFSLGNLILSLLTFSEHLLGL
jgi:Zn-dependent protease